MSVIHVAVSVASFVRTGAVAGRAGDRAERACVAGALGHVGGAQLRRARASGAREAARRRRLARLRVVRADGAACSGKRTDPRVSVWTPGRTSKGGVWLRAVLVHDVEVVALVLYVPAPHTVSQAKPAGTRSAIECYRAVCTLDRQTHLHSCCRWWRCKCRRCRLCNIDRWDVRV